MVMGRASMVSGVCAIVNGNEQLDRLDLERYHPTTWVGPICLAGLSTSSCDCSPTSPSSTSPASDPPPDPPPTLTKNKRKVSFRSRVVPLSPRLEEDKVEEEEAEKKDRVEKWFIYTRLREALAAHSSDPAVHSPLPVTHPQTTPPPHAPNQPISVSHSISHSPHPSTKHTPRR
jgi:hypothetical protein